MNSEFTSCDWGTTNLRVRIVRADAVIKELRTEQGASTLKSPEEFRTALGAAMDSLGAAKPVVISGMAGSSIGWKELPYARLPFRLDGSDAVVEEIEADTFLISGVRSEDDVMRGEETQIAGALALMPGFDGVLCLPGTHSKWVQISAGEVVSFQTYLTGEMFSLLSTQSVLRHGMAATGWDKDAFDLGVANGMARPERLAAHLFRLRAEGLIADLGPDAARAQLSGLFIGAELAAARPYWLGARVVLVGSPELTALYARALAAMGAPSQTLPAKDCTIAGLARAAGRLMKAAE
jgi:2-dehydro-3-deoxygalactonokinase